MVSEEYSTILQLSSLRRSGELPGLQVWNLSGRQSHCLSSYRTKVYRHGQRHLSLVHLAISFARLTWYRIFYQEDSQMIWLSWH